MSYEYSKRKKKFFDGDDYVVVKEEKFLGLNVGYECTMWRYKPFVNLLFSYLVEFATQFSDLDKVNADTA